MVYRSVFAKQCETEESYQQVLYSANYLLFSKEGRHRDAMREYLRDHFIQRGVLPSKFIIKKGAIILGCEYSKLVNTIRVRNKGVDLVDAIFGEEDLHVIIGDIKDKERAKELEGREIPFYS
jgi:hypothetical protein